MFSPDPDQVDEVYSDDSESDDEGNESGNAPSQHRERPQGHNSNKRDAIKLKRRCNKHLSYEQQIMMTLRSVLSEAQLVDVRDRIIGGI